MSTPVDTSTPVRDLLMRELHVPTAEAKFLTAYTMSVINATRTNLTLHDFADMIIDSPAIIAPVLPADEDLLLNSPSVIEHKDKDDSQAVVQAQQSIQPQAQPPEEGVAKADDVISSGLIFEMDPLPPLARLWYSMKDWPSEKRQADLPLPRFAQSTKLQKPRATAAPAEQFLLAPARDVIASVASPEEIPSVDSTAAVQQNDNKTEVAMEVDKQESKSMTSLMSIQLPECVASRNKEAMLKVLASDELHPVSSANSAHQKSKKLLRSAVRALSKPPVRPVAHPLTRPSRSGISSMKPPHFDCHKLPEDRSRRKTVHRPHEDDDRSKRVRQLADKSKRKHASHERHRDDRTLKVHRRSADRHCSVERRQHSRERHHLLEDNHGRRADSRHHHHHRRHHH
jgi:hypothetical protein